MDTASSPFSISPREFACGLGRAGAALVLDVRRDVGFEESDRIVPRAERCAPQDVEQFARSREPRDVVVYCVHGLEIGQEAAQRLREAGWPARFLEGGIEGLSAAGMPIVKKRPDLGVTGERPSRWVTREQPLVDRVACAWLVWRFVDPRAQFFFVPCAEVLAAAKRLDAVPFDTEGAPLTHVWERCSFDAFVAAFEIRDPALDALATIVRGADTARLQLAPQAAGMLAISLGLSRLHPNDRAMLEAAMPVYDALYAWCRDAQDETHTWKAHV